MIDELRDDLVILRRYRNEDIPALFEAACSSIDEVYPWLPWCHPGYQLMESQEWVGKQIQRWDEGKEFEFTIYNHQKEFVGGCGLNQINPLYKIANLGYWIKTGRTGHGYARAATRQLAEFGLTQLGLKRIEIVVAVQNLPSQRVAEHTGARKEGVFRNRLLLHGQCHDALIYPLCRKIWRDLRSKPSVTLGSVA